MPTDEQVQQLVEGVLRDVRAKVEAEVSSLVSRMREHADQQQRAAVDNARAAAEAKARDVLVAAEAKARETIAAAEAKARDAVATVQADAARRTEEAVAQTKEDAKRLIESARAEAMNLVQKAVAEARSKERQAELAGAERLIEAVRAFDHARSLSEVLHLLADKAAEIAPRVAVFTVEGRRLHSWRVIGFPGPLSETGFESDINDGDILGTAIATGQACTTSSTTSRVPTFAQIRDGRVGMAVPLEVAGQVVAVLYADDDANGNADRTVPSAWPEVAELLARHASRCLQALTGARVVEALAGTNAQESMN